MQYLEKLKNHHVVITDFGERLAHCSFALIFLIFGLAKFTVQEAEAIYLFVSNSPLTSWLYALFDKQGVSNLFGIIEVSVGVLFLAGGRWPFLGVLGACGSIVTFLVTSSFLFSTPGVEDPSLGGFPYFSVVPGQFLLKDLILLAGSVWLLGSFLKKL